MELFTYFRSSAAYRVRIALNLKGLKAEQHFIHLVKDGGQQHKPEFRKVNPQGFVPALIDQGHTITQSIAIVEYLDETHPNPPLLPKDALGRARVRALALVIAADIHPLQNTRITKYLDQELKQDEAARKRWIQRWVTEGFTALEKMLAKDPATGKFCHGDTPTMADVLLVPQMFSARRFGVDLEPFPTLRRIDEHCQSLKAFQDAHPSKQPDFEP
ncbi:MAG TPA: maleylacetoacetate isomerase [Gammaproteobacteria bacterium]|nr:maleylacetoacetate isomerase [Gammaproteobacteria bacterium]